MTFIFHKIIYKVPHFIETLFFDLQTFFKLTVMKLSFTIKKFDHKNNLINDQLLYKSLTNTKIYALMLNYTFF